MQTYQKLASDAAIAIAITDAFGRLMRQSHEARLTMIEEIVVKTLEIAQAELLASQQETAVALAQALNVASGK